MKTFLERTHDFLGSGSAKLLFLSLMMMFLGSFLLTTYQKGHETVCGEVEFVLERNMDLERDLMRNGQGSQAKRLHHSLIELTKQVDYCSMSTFKKILKGRPK